MKIGDTVFIHGYIDEIRKDTVIIRNKGGYFGTIPSEVIFGKIPEHKTGKWICSDDLYETAICPFCGWDTTEPYGHIRSWFRYCPRCGARLVQEGEDNG